MREVRAQSMNAPPLWRFIRNRKRLANGRPTVTGRLCQGEPGFIFIGQVEFARCPFFCSASNSARLAATRAEFCLWCKVR